MRVAALVIAVVVAGCVHAEPAEAPETRDSTVEPPVVVAVIDSGINPYHAAFRARTHMTPPAGVDAIEVALTSAVEPAEGIVQDAAFWENVTEGQLYAFAGTRLLAISFGTKPGSLAIFDNIDEDGHGTATASLVAREAPEALIVSVQIDDVACSLSDPTGRCPVFPQIAAAMEWAASQPWIDVISMSLALPGNPPTSEEMAPEVARVVAATEEASRSGKLVVVSAGNVPATAVTSYMAGPPWVVAVGGYEPETQGDRPDAGKAVDFVANYTEQAATAASAEGSATFRGTSFATPIVAGVAARSLQVARAAATATTAVSLRPALNASAELPTPTHFRPAAPSDPNPLNWTLSTPSVLPGIQHGWGYVDGSAVQRIVAALSGSPPPRDPSIQLAMEAYQASREAAWG